VQIAILKNASIQGRAGDMRDKFKESRGALDQKYLGTTDVCHDFVQDNIKMHSNCIRLHKTTFT
jgi:hypothetical protein